MHRCRLLIQASTWVFAVFFFIVGAVPAAENAVATAGVAVGKNGSPEKSLAGLLSRSGTCWGFADAQGRIVRPALYSRLGKFNEGLAYASRGGKYGFINEKGEEVIDFRFDKAGSFSEGFAKVRIGKKWGFVTATGKMLCECRFGRVGDFHEGLAAASDSVGASGTGTRGYVNSRGEWAIRLDSPALMRPFSEGLAIIQKFSEKGGSTFAVVARNGKELRAFPEEQLPLSDFSEGLIVVHNKKTKRTGYMNALGRIVIGQEFLDAGRFSGGLAPVALANTGTPMCSYGYIDKNGVIQIQPRFYAGNRFSEGLAWVKVAPGKGGYIDRTGVFVIEPEYYSGTDFRQGFATVCTVEGKVHTHHSGPITTTIVSGENIKDYILDRAGNRTRIIWPDGGGGHANTNPPGATRRPVKDMDNPFED